MRAAIHNQFGDPAAVMEFAEVPAPVAAKGEVLIRTILSPIHNHDLWTIRGEYGYKPSLPGAIGGTEAVGIVEAVGEGVDSSLIGARIAVAAVHGTWAERFVAPAATIVPLPEGIPDELGAQLIAMPFSAIALLEFVQAEAGDWVIQTAANGAVGKIMVSLAKERGLKLLNLVRRKAAAEELTALGVENVLSTDEPGWKEKAREIIGEKGAVTAIDSVGGAIALDLTDLLGRNGELISFGTSTGELLQLSTHELITKHLKIRGFWAALIFEEMSAETQIRLLTELVTLAAKGALRLETGGIYPLEQVREAMMAAQTSGRAGKIMLRP
ncbi:zinc-binding dehydrogenase [Paracoccus ravus]|uniref:zinc-binding dehydrogenase n=1 Tax=Paracoccus ravus TaxID=2447760 RepID=UPI00106ED635|nr:zinc-binding dehydrogenase [Paracoccus ravus]